MVVILYGCRQDVGNYQCVDYDDDELQLDPGMPFDSFFVASYPTTPGLIETSFCVCVSRLVEVFQLHQF